VAKVRVAGEHVGFHCPGCNDYHQITTGPNGWTWNGSEDAPTFTPSLLAEYLARDDAPDDVKAALARSRCHSFVTDGRIQFLSDCGHALAGQTVDLPEWSGF
jgi:hypothetical protein